MLSWLKIKAPIARRLHEKMTSFLVFLPPFVLAHERNHDALNF